MRYKVYSISIGVDEKQGGKVHQKQRVNSPK